MEFTAKQIASLIAGKIIGKEDVVINGLTRIEDGKEGCLCFLNDTKYEKHLASSKASIIIISEKISLKESTNATLIVVKDAQAAFLILLDTYNKMQNERSGIEDPSFIHKNSTFGENLYLGAFSYVGKDSKLGNDVKIYPNSFLGDNVIIGNNVIIYAGVKIYRNVVIGNNCIIHSGAVIGSDGFGYKIDENKNSQKIPHIGNVIIEDNCEIGANSTIDRATMGSTILRQGVKIDNLVQIAHNVQIGENSRLSAQSGVAGSTVIGANCVFGGQAAVADHLVIAKGTKLGAQTGVNKSILDQNTFVNGSPAMGYRDSLLSIKYFQNLPDLARRIAALEKELSSMLIKEE